MERVLCSTLAGDHSSQKGQKESWELALIQSKQRNTVTHGTTNEISSAMRTSTLFMHLLLWSGKVWFSLELRNAI